MIFIITKASLLPLEKMKNEIKYFWGIFVRAALRPGNFYSGYRHDVAVLLVIEVLLIVAVTPICNLTDNHVSDLKLSKLDRLFL